ncbi:phosphatase PAP2 family protein [Streptomyces coeruleoprunus]|uniref:Phosphatase PAP2 family protein n=1 Tax=Streptomyces coeruleoprunus TaxID=285563 RepID=A0ABV9XMA2_9ACTN
MRSPTLAPPPTRAPHARAVAGWTGVLALALLVLVVAGWGPLMAFDRAVAEALHASAVSSPVATGVNRVLTDWVWDPWTMRGLVAVVAVVLWRRGERWPAGLLVVVSVLASGLQQALKALVGRDRPRWEDPVDAADFAAFPSGHAMTVVVTFGLLWWVAVTHGARAARAARPLVAVGVVSAVGVGLTRVYLGVHWVSDVVAGWLLGACVVALAIAVHARHMAGRRG